jgi:uncharacterized protein
LNPWGIVGLGFVVGNLVGLTGVGGGVLLTPVLIIFLGVRPSIAIGTDLFYASITKVAGAVKHWHQGSVHLRLAATLATGSVPAALVGVGGAKMVKDRLGQATEPIITSILAWVCVFVAVAMLLRVVTERFGKPEGAARRILTGRRLKWSTVLLGVVTGLLVGLTSIGAGTILMIFLVSLYRIPTSQLIGTDIFHAAILAGVSAVGHYWAGNIDFHLASLLLMGSVPGVIIGSRISIRIPETLLRVSVALVMGFSGARLIIG